MHQMRTVIQEDFKTALQEVDLLLSLVAPTAADMTGILQAHNPCFVFRVDFLGANTIREDE